MGKLTIYCCYHEKAQRIDDDQLTIRFYGPDGLLNPYLSEFSMFYDIRQNDKDSAYIGTSHYRRRIYSSDFDESLVNENSCQIYEIIKGNKYSGYFGVRKWSSDNWHQCERLRLDYLEYLNSKYGADNKYIEADRKVGNEEFFMMSRSSGIFTRSHFMNMCDYIFGFLDYLDKKYKLDYNPKNYEKWLAKSYISKIHGWPPVTLKCENHAKRLLAGLFEVMVSMYIYTNITQYYLVNINNIVKVYPRTGRIGYLVYAREKLKNSVTVCI